GFTDKQKLLMRHPGWEGGASFSQGVFSFYIRGAEVAEVILILH
ncbi:hypothetical protein D3OALGB2SA_940, partial [Olavius algarvensis associated proteobacterium Delta 3]